MLIRLLKWLGGFLATLLVLIVMYFAASVVGALLPKKVSQQNAQKDQNPKRVYLVTGLLHADIAIPFSKDLLQRFPELAKTSLPLDNSGLHYLLFGWGSKAFYTTAGSYSDIELSAVFKAVTGDSSVMRITAAGKLEPSQSIVPVDMNDAQFDDLLTAISASFAGGEGGEFLPGVSIGPYDAFFEGEGRFNVFHPCNQWVNQTLHSAGIPIGRWTPTTHSLLMSLAYHKSGGFQE